MNSYIFRQVRLRSGKTALFGTKVLKEGVGGTSQLEQLGVLRVWKSQVHEVDGWPLRRKKPVNSPNSSVCFDNRLKSGGDSRTSHTCISNSVYYVGKYSYRQQCKTLQCHVYSS